MPPVCRSAPLQSQEPKRATAQKQTLSGPRRKRVGFVISSFTSLNRRGRSGGADLCDVFVFLRRVAAYTDCADDFAFVDDGDSALKRRSARQSQSSDAPITNLVFENLAGPAEDCRSPSLADSHFDAGHLRVIQPFKDQQMSAVIHHHNDNC